MDGRGESTFGEKNASRKKVTCYECNEPGHYKNDCPKLKKDKKPKKAYKDKKGLIETWDDSESEDEDSDAYEEWEDIVDDLEDQIDAVQEAIDALEDECED